MKESKLEEAIQIIGGILAIPLIGLLLYGINNMIEFDYKARKQDRTFNHMVAIQGAPEPQYTELMEKFDKEYNK